MSDGSKWRLSAMLGNTGECREWLSWFVRSESATDQDGHVGTSGARYWWCCCFRTSGARYWWCCCCVPVVTTVVLEKLRILWWPVCNCVRASRTLRLITGSMVLAHANSSEVRDCSRSSSGTSRTRRSWANMSGGRVCRFHALFRRLSNTCTGVVWAVFSGCMRYCAPIFQDLAMRPEELNKCCGLVRSSWWSRD
jgi:hypothetical protein